MKEFLLRLFKYNEWANNLMLEILLKEQYKNEKILKLFCHLISAQKIWSDRLSGSRGNIELWSGDTLEGCINVSKLSSTELLRYVEKLDESRLNERLSYMNTKGEPCMDKISDILAQIINHSTHHRAQISILLRQEDIAPPATDLIFYARQNP